MSLGKLLGWHQGHGLPEGMVKIRTTVVQGGAEMIGGEVQRFPRDGGSRTTTAAVGDESVIVTSVEQTSGSQEADHSQTSGAKVL